VLHVLGPNLTQSSSREFVVTFFALRTRDLFGGFGEFLINGMAKRNGNGSLELRRTGPFVPPVTFLNWLNTLVVTDPVRRSLTQALPVFPPFQEVVLTHIPEFRWEHWDRTKEVPIEQFPPIQEIEDVIDGQPHSPAAARAIGVLWECKAEPLPGVTTELMNQRYYGDDDCDIRLTARQCPHQEFFGGSRGDIIVSGRVKECLEQRAEGWLTFQDVVFEKSS
jgi:hypothetical protein